MSFIAVAVGGSAIAGIAGASMQSGAAKDAGQLQYDAAHEANQLQGRMWDEQKQMYQDQMHQQRSDSEPWRQAGMGALSQLQDPSLNRTFGASDFQKDPGYDFRMQQGQQALDRSAAARGGAGGGAAMKAMARYGQDYASNEYQNAYNRFNTDRDSRLNRLSSLAGVGQTATAQLGNNSAAMTGQLGSLGSAYAGNMGNNLMGAANAQGAAGIAGANAWGGALSGIGNMAMQGAWMNKLSQPPSGPGWGGFGGTPMAGESYFNPSVVA